MGGGERGGGGEGRGQEGRGGEEEGRGGAGREVEWRGREGEGTGGNAKLAIKATNCSCNYAPVTKRHTCKYIRRPLCIYPLCVTVAFTHEG